MAEMRKGDHVGQYVLEKRIGSGAFGEVWRAQHAEGRWHVAVKLPKTAELAAMLAREGQLAAKLKALKHPNICEILDLSLTSSPPYIVYEYVDGEDLATRLRRGPMEPRAVLQMAREVLGGLAVAHQAGIVHRDIKPSNILFTADGHAKLTDFGIGIAIQQQSFMPSMEERQNEAALAGTVGYLAPEQMSGEEATPASDVFSLGVVLHEALTGQRPWGAERPSDTVRGVPGGLDECISQALQRSPADRPPARQIVDTLQMGSHVTSPQGRERLWPGLLLVKESDASGGTQHGFKDGEVQDGEPSLRPVNTADEPVTIRWMLIWLASVFTIGLTVAVFADSWRISEAETTPALTVTLLTAELLAYIASLVLPKASVVALGRTALACLFGCGLRLMMALIAAKLVAGLTASLDELWMDFYSGLWWVAVIHMTLISILLRLSRPLLGGQQTAEAASSE